MPSGAPAAIRFLLQNFAQSRRKCPPAGLRSKTLLDPLVVAETAAAGERRVVPIDGYVGRRWRVETFNVSCGLPGGCGRRDGKHRRGDDHGEPGRGNGAEEMAASMVDLFGTADLVH